MTTTEPRLWNTAQLRRQIADKQYQQAQRRAHLADLQAIIDRHDLAIANLMAQLNTAAGRTACDEPNTFSSAAPSATDNSGAPEKRT